MLKSSHAPSGPQAARVALTVLLALGALACGGEAGSTDTARLLRQGRESFVAGDFARAGELFRAAAVEAPDDYDARLGIARSAHQLHDYDAALTAYQEALELAPDDPLVWRSYIEALYRGGVFAGDGARLEKALELAPRALRHAPDEVEIYEYVLRTAAELNRLDDYLPILDSAAADLPLQPALQIELAKARILDAQRARNAAAGGPEFDVLATTVEDLEAALRTDLEATAARAVENVDTSPAALYKLALGYDLLGEPRHAGEWLEALDRTAPGRQMAAPVRYEQFLGDWVSTFDGEAAARIAVAERWLPRFKPEWTDDGSRYRAILGMQFDVMVAAAREALAEAESKQQPIDPGSLDDGKATAVAAVVSEVQADRLARIGRELARTDSGRRAARFVETASVLARIPSHYLTAVRVADEGIEALRQSRPGLFYPGTHEDDREEIERRYTAVLMQLQGQALHNLGRDEAAEDVLRQAIAAYPVAAGYAMLAGLLLDQGRDAEAFDLFVAALARGFAPGEAALEEQTRASAGEAAARIGATAEVVDQAIASAAGLVEEERDLEILADPLDVPAPDFELDDSEGRKWRLSELAGKVVVLNYWATWCGPCVAEMPYYQSLVDEYRDVADVVFLAISTDSDSSVVEPFMRENGYTFNVLFDQGSSADFGVSGVPAGLIIGTGGLIKYRSFGFPGPQRYLREMRLRIEALRAAER